MGPLATTLRAGLMSPGDKVALASAAIKVATVNSANSPYTAVTQNLLYVDTTAGAVTINLPASPSQGDLVQVRWDTGTNLLTIARNGSTIEGQSQDLNFDLIGQQGTTFGFRFMGGTWRVE